MTTPTRSRARAADLLGPLLEQGVAALGGQLPVRVRFWDGSSVGPADAVTVVLRRRRALRHLLWSPDEIGLARAYVSGDLQVEGSLFTALEAVLGLIRPENIVGKRPGPRTLLALAGASARLGVLGPRPRPPAEEVRLRGGRHSRGRDAEAIAHHYDIGNEFYRLVLGASMTYTAAYWPEQDCDPTDSAALEAAQYAKCELISGKLGLGPGMRLLDVGCGWGTLALHAARAHGAHVVGVTLSEQQAVFARKRMAEEGVSDLVEIRVQDYREVDDAPFDAVASIGMAEHVGSGNLGAYAARLFELVRPGGRLLNSAISLRPDDPQKEPEPSSFIERYVFPDGELQTLAAMVGALEDSGFEVRDVQALREHYALTLRAWVANLERDIDAAAAASTPGRARVWQLYMTASALAFEANELGVSHVLAVRPDARGRSGFALQRSAPSPE